MMMILSLRRIYGLLLRQFYAVRRSLPRLCTFIFWPFLQMMIWGLFNKFLAADHQALGFAMSALLGAALLLTFIERTNANTMLAFMEDLRTGNLGNLVISPTETIELGISFLIAGTLATAFGLGVAGLCAYLIFGYSILSLGMSFLLWWLCLTVTGWGIGLVLVSMLLRFGAGNEPFGWMACMALSPFFCAFYPVSALPHYLQNFALLLPPTYVFEGLRNFLKTDQFDYTIYTKGLAMALLFLALSVANFFHQLHQARARSGLFNAASS